MDKSTKSLFITSKEPPIDQSAEKNISETMKDVEKIRNISVAGSFTSGKGTIVDCINNTLREDSPNKKKLCKNWLFQSIENNEVVDFMGRSKGYMFSFQRPYDEEEEEEEGENPKTKFLFNLIDTVGHSDFSGDTSCDLRLTDGMLLVVDYTEGICIQTERLLQKAISYRIKPVLVITKMDMIFKSKDNRDLELIYQNIFEIIEGLNTIISTLEDETIRNWTFSPRKRNVIFCSGKQSWGFTLSRYVEKYWAMFDMSRESLLKKLWGENYYKQKSKKWSKKPFDQEKKRRRTFSQFCLSPIIELRNLCMDSEKKKKLKKILKKMEIEVNAEDLKKLEKEELFEWIMKRFLPLSPIVFDTFIRIFPDPKTAQSYRTELMYPFKTDKYYKDITSCNSDGNLMMYVSKMIPYFEGKRFLRYLSFGRVFSGTLKSYQQVRFMRSDYRPGSKHGLVRKKGVRQIMLYSSFGFQSVDSIPCGNLCYLAGIDSYVSGLTTISDSEDEELCYPFIPVRIEETLLRKIVEPSDPRDLLRLVEGLKNLADLDKGINCLINKDTGCHYIECSGIHQLSKSIIDFKRLTLFGGAWDQTSFTFSDPPIVSYRETVTAESDRLCLSKSPNKHNRLFARAQPLTEELAVEILKENSVFSAFSTNKKARARNLITFFGWEPQEARKIWCFGPRHEGTNCVVDRTRGIQYLEEIRDSVVAGFQWASQEGVLCNEPMRGIRFNLEDVVYYADAIHRGGGQIIPCARRVFYGCQMTAKPTLMEPISLIEIKKIKENDLGEIYGLLNQFNGSIISEKRCNLLYEGNKYYSVKGYIPVRKTAFISQEMGSFLERCKAISGSIETVFDHWKNMNGYFIPDDDKHYNFEECLKLIFDIRKRKGLRDFFPNLSRFNDKL